MVLINTLVLLGSSSSFATAFVVVTPSTRTIARIHSSSTSALNESSSAASSPPPQTFREAEILGLTLMQEGDIQEALKVFQKGLNLPGSKKDIIRTQLVSGPSPVGGSSGGTEGKIVQSLDEFEMQAAHYNIACAYSRLDKAAESCASLGKAFMAGFDNYATVRADPDLSSIHGTVEFQSLMEKYDSKKGFNPFGLFG